MFEKVFAVNGDDGWPSTDVIEAEEMLSGSVGSFDGGQLVVCDGCHMFMD